MTDALKLAADDGDLKEVTRLIEEEDVPIYAADAWGDTALHAAVARGRLSMMQGVVGLKRLHFIY
jgi:ankyrin repeat protein